MLLPVPLDVQMQRVPEHATSKHKPAGKVHVVLGGYALHDLAQKTKADGRWPWKHEVERVTDAEWWESPCLICQAALNGKPLPGYV